MSHYDVSESGEEKKSLWERNYYSDRILRSLPVPAFAIDRCYNVICWNPALEEYTGITSEEMLGTDDYWKPFFDKKRPMPADLLLDCISGDSEISSYDRLSPVINRDKKTECFRNRNGEDVWFRMSAELLKDEEGKILGAVQVFEDITSFKMAESELIRTREYYVESAKEKEILLKEVHHRVKNNLQIIISILKLHSYNSDDPKLKNVLQDCYNQVNSMSMLHEKIYRSDTLSDVDANDHIRSLCSYLINEISARSEDVKLLTDIDPDIRFSLGKGIHISLLLNEMLTNSLKYAFCGDNSGQILISLHKANSGNYRLVYSDNGCGLPDGFRIEDSDSLGFELIINLAAQLDGMLEIENDGGLKYTLIFPLK